MVYYISLLTINQFNTDILENFDKVLLRVSKSKEKKLTPRLVSRKLNISELEALKLLYESEKIGLVRLTYSINCNNCNTLIELDDITNLNSIKCNKCYNCSHIDDMSNINYYYSVLI
jgi:hypothetical protein